MVNIFNKFLMLKINLLLVLLFNFVFSFDFFVVCEKLIEN